MTHLTHEMCEIEIWKLANLTSNLPTNLTRRAFVGTVSLRSSDIRPTTEIEIMLNEANAGSAAFPFPALKAS